MRAPADHETIDSRTPRSVRPAPLESVRGAGPQGVRVPPATSAPALQAVLPQDIYPDNPTPGRRTARWV